MRKIIILSMIGLCTHCAVAGTDSAQVETNAPAMGTLDYLDWRYGFRDVRFGQTLSSMTNMDFIAENGGYQFYKRQHDQVGLGKLELTYISYGFYKGRLARVECEARLPDVVDRVLDVLEAAYGPSEQKAASPRTRSWEGRHTYVQFDRHEDRAVLTIGSKVIYAEKARDEQEAAKEDAKFL